MSFEARKKVWPQFQREGWRWQGVGQIRGGPYLSSMGLGEDDSSATLASIFSKEAERPELPHELSKQTTGQPFAGLPKSIWGPTGATGQQFATSVVTLQCTANIAVSLFHRCLK